MASMEDRGGHDLPELDRLGRLLGTASAADTMRVAVEFTLHFAEAARAAGLGRPGADPTQLDLLGRRSA